MSKSFIEKSVAAVAAVAASFAVVFAVVSIAEHEREQAVFLAAKISPQHVAAGEASASVR